MVKLNAITNKLKHSKAVRKVLSVIVSASLAVSMLAVNVFAAEGDSSGPAGIDYSSLISTITSGFTTVIQNCVTIAVAVIPLGLGLMGLGKMWDVAKKFFTKATT